MNFRRKLAMVIPVVVMTALAIAFVAVPAGAVNQTLGQPGGGKVLNNPGPVPKMINYQGYLTDADGNPINETLEMTFSIYDSAEATTPLWTETHPSVVVTNGLFNVLLGSYNPILNSHVTGETYLGVQVGADPEMTPRQQIVSVAYALRSIKAADANTLDDMDSADFVAVAGDTMTGQLVLPADGLVAGTNQLVLNGGKVGIGTTTPGNYQLNVQGGSNSGIHAEGNAIGVDGMGKTGVNGTGTITGVNGDGLLYGVYGFTTGDGIGVYGYNEDYGNHGRLGTVDEGVYGENSASGNYGRIGTEDEGVYGYNSSSGNYGMLGTSSYGVYGNGGSYGMYGQSSSGYGVFGQSSSGTGVYGTGGSNGVYGYNSISGNHGHLGTSSYGVYGYNYGSGNYGELGTSSYGVSGYNYGSGNYGELGTSSSGVHGTGGDYGVLGYSISGSGVYGGTSSGYAGYFNGNVRITGSLTVIGTKSFVGKDPSNPNKDIYYAALEGPEAGTYIRGSAELKDGTAVIDLPGYFTDVTSDKGLTIQLTPTGKWLQLYVVEKSTAHIVIREATGQSGTCDYFVQGIRKGYEDFQVLRDSSSAGGEE